MTLPASFPLSASQINVELGRSAGAAFDIQGATERALAEIPAGAISMSDFLGKSNQETSFIGTTLIGSGSASYSTAINYGAAHAQRRVVVAVHWETVTNDVSLNSATIGGVGATIHVQRHHTGGATGLGVALISALVPTGTSGNLDVTFSTTTSRCYAGTYRLKNYNTLVNSGSDQTSGTTGPVSVNVATTSPGVAIGAYTGSTGTVGGNITWTNVTEQYEVSDVGRFGGAWLTGLSSGSINVNATQGVIINAGNDLVAVSWST